MSITDMLGGSLVGMGSLGMTQPRLGTVSRDCHYFWCCGGLTQYNKKLVSHRVSSGRRRIANADSLPVQRP
jgi:hypothetical protein